MYIWKRGRVVEGNPALAGKTVVPGTVPVIGFAPAFAGRLADAGRIPKEIMFYVSLFYKFKKISDFI